MEEEKEDLNNEIENSDSNKKKLGDKIFGAHKNPTKEADYSDNFEVDSNHKFVETYYDEQEYLHKKRLEEVVYEAFQTSRWFPLSYKKKIPKDLIPHLFQEVLEKLDETEFSFSEKFVCICDYIQIPYTKAYEIAPIKYRELIINELEVKYKILSKKKIKRLF